jgi:acetyl esterase/lipase
MQSLRSRIIIGLVKHRHLLQGHWKREIVDESFSVEAFRREVDQMSGKMQKMPPGIHLESTKINGMVAEWIFPEKAPTEKVILYIHGGGFISGSCFTHRGHVAKIVAEAQVKALLFDYRLAPEHPFPAAVEDCVAVYRWLLTQGYLPKNIILCGESAGGTLTLATLIALRDQGIELPCGGVSISPITDLTCQAQSFHTNAYNDIAPYNSWIIWTRHYIGESDPTLPWLSPQYAMLGGLPPLYMCVGTKEIHLDDTVNFANKARQSGCQVELVVVEGMVHAYPLLSPLFPEAKRGMGDICRFIRERLDARA